MVKFDHKSFVFKLGFNFLHSSFIYILTVPNTILSRLYNFRKKGYEAQNTDMSYSICTYMEKKTIALSFQTLQNQGNLSPQNRGRLIPLCQRFWCLGILRWAWKDFLNNPIYLYQLYKNVNNLFRAHKPLTLRTRYGTCVGYQVFTFIRVTDNFPFRRNRFYFNCWV